MTASSSTQTPCILVCPISKTVLRREGEFLISETGIKYPVKDGIPILLPAAAIPATALPPSAQVMSSSLSR